MENLRKELLWLKKEFGVVHTEWCSSEEENHFDELRENELPLPNNVLRDDDGKYFRFVDVGISEQESKELLLYRQVVYLRTINNGVRFFVVLSVISIVLSFLLAIGAFA